MSSCQSCLPLTRAKLAAPRLSFGVSCGCRTPSFARHQEHLLPQHRYHRGALHCRAARITCQAQGSQNQGLGPQEGIGLQGDGFLDVENLSPDVWSYKPPWCQPYTILATGAGLTAGTWAVSGGSPWWTLLVALPIGLWWWGFLVVYPEQFRQYVLQQQAAEAALRGQRRPPGEA